MALLGVREGNLSENGKENKYKTFTNFDKYNIINFRELFFWGGGEISHVFFFFFNKSTKSAI